MTSTGHAEREAHMERLGAVHRLDHAQLGRGAERLTLGLLWAIPLAFFTNLVLANSSLLTDGIILVLAPLAQALFAALLMVTVCLASVSWRRRAAAAPAALPTAASIGLLFTAPLESWLWSGLLLVIVLLGIVFMWEGARASLRRLLATVFAIVSMVLFALWLVLVLIGSVFVQNSELGRQGGPGGWTVVVSQSNQGALGGSIDVVAERTLVHTVTVVLPLHTLRSTTTRTQISAGLTAEPS